MPHGQARDVNRDSSCSDDGEEEDDAFTIHHALHARESERERERQRRQGHLRATSHTHLHGEEEEEEERRRQSLDGEEEALESERHLHREEEDGLGDHAHRVLNHHAQHVAGPAYTPLVKRFNRGEATPREGRASSIDKFTK